jgi:hypothetical protein
MSGNHDLGYKQLFASNYPSQLTFQWPPRPRLVHGWRVKHGEMIPEVQRLLEGEAMGERVQRRYANLTEYILDAGQQLGREEGREEGKLLTLRAVLTRQLAQRFGPLSAATATRIDEATEDEVERWVDGVLAADSAEALIAS